MTVRWGRTWEETIEGNREEEWRKELEKGKAGALAVQRIVGLRRVALLEAMAGRFPERKEKQAEALGEMAAVCGRIGLPSRAREHAGRLAREFPERKDVLARTYAELLERHAGNFGDEAEWEETIRAAMTLAEGMKGEEGKRLAAAACGGLAELMVKGQRYDLLLGQVERMEGMAGRAAAVNGAVARVLWGFGYVAPACVAAKKAGEAGAWLSGDENSSPGGLLDPRPQEAQLQARWEALLGAAKVRGRKDGVRPEEVQRVLDMTARGGVPLEKSQSHWVSGRAVLEEVVGGMSAEGRAALREMQEKAVRPLAHEIRQTWDWEALMRVSGRYPWSRTVGELLLEMGERELRAGRAEWAAGAFREVLRGGGDEDLAAAGRAGLWMALAEEGGAAGRRALEEELAEATEGPGQERKMPWRGRELAVGEVKRELRQRLAASGVGATAGADFAAAGGARRVVRLPAGWPGERRKPDGPVLDGGLHAGWPVSGAQAAGEGLIVWGHGVVGRFGADGSPGWTMATGVDGKTWDSLAAERILRGSPGWLPTCRPVGAGAAADGGTIYCLVRDPEAIAAVEAATGRAAWSTAARADWKGLTPMTVPAVAGERLYVLAVPAGLGPEAGGGPGKIPGQTVLWELVCADAADGRVLWRTPLAWQPYTLLDLARGGQAVTVREGAVYCSTNMGVLARCDARNGTIEWIRGYACAADADGRSRNLSREGTSPLPAGRALLVAPRDHAGVLAIHRDTGETLWESRFAPSDKLLGLAGRALLAVNDQWLAALDVATGRCLWLRRFPDGTAGRAALAGATVLVLTGRPALGPVRLHRLDAATGRALDETPVPSRDADDLLLLADGSIVDVRLPRPASPPPAPGPAGPLGNLFEEIANLPFDRPVIHWPAEGGVPESFLVVSGRRLALVKTRPAAVAWEKLLPAPPQCLALRAGRVLLAVGPTLWALDAADGSPRWRLRLPFSPGLLAAEGAHAFAFASAGLLAWAAGIDAADGRLLWAGPALEPLRLAAPPAAVLTGPEGLALYCPSVLFADEGLRPGEIFLDPRTGQLRQLRRFLPAEPGWPADIQFSPDAIRYIDSTGRPHALPRAGGPDPASAWTRRADLSPRGRYGPVAAGLSVTPAGLAIRAVSQLFLFDPAAGRETAFDLPPNPIVHRSRVPQPRTNLILDLHESAGLLLVASATTGEAIVDWGKYWRDASDPAWSRLFVDVFDRASGRHLGRQQLGSLPWCTYATHAHDTRVRFLGSLLVVTSPAGLHLYQPSASAAKISEPPPAPPIPAPSTQPKRPPGRKGKRP